MSNAIRQPVPMHKIMELRWMQNDTEGMEKLRQIDEQIAGRAEQIITFIRHLFVQDDSIRAYYGRRFLLSIGGAKTTDREIHETADYGATDTLLRDVFSHIEARIAPVANSDAKMPAIDEKMSAMLHVNEEQWEAAAERMSGRIRGLIYMMRDIMSADEQFHLSSILRHAGGEEMEKSRYKQLLSSVIGSHPYGREIFAIMEETIAEFGVNVNEEITPLVRMRRGIIDERISPAQTDVK
jgi:hypothetical protein